MLPASLRIGLAAALTALLLLAHAASVSAHAGSVAFWHISCAGDVARSQVLMSLDDVRRLAPGIRADPGDVRVEQLAAIDEGVLRHFVVLEAGVPAVSRVIGARVLPSGLLEVRVEHRLHGDGRALDIRSTFHHMTDDSHRVVTRIEREGASEAVVLTADTPQWAVPRSGLSQRPATGPLAMIWLGIAHILTGYDHLAFLACLLVPGGTWRSRVAIVSAFTVAHSLTLVLAATGAVTPPARFVELAIALSIAYVAIENLLSGPMDTVEPGRGDRRTSPAATPWGGTRWPTAFVFGLMHGFGFAGMLGVLDMPVRDWLTAVLAFNIGVEMGQLAVVALALPLIVLMARSSWHRQVVQSTSVLVLGLAFVWFVERLQ